MLAARAVALSDVAGAEPSVVVVDRAPGEDGPLAAEALRAARDLADADRAADGPAARDGAAVDPDTGNPGGARRAHDTEGWITAPIRRARGPVLGGLHVLPGVGSHHDDAELRALWVVAETAVPFLLPGQAGPADRPDLVAARALNRLATSADDYPTLIAGIAAAIAPVVDATKVGVALWSDARQYLQTLPGSFGAGDAMAHSSQVDGTDEHSGAARAWRTGRTVFTNDSTAALPGFVPWLRAFGVDQLLSTPLVLGDRPIGVLHVANHRTGFDAESVAAVETVAPFVAGCVDLVRHRRELHRTGTVGGVITQMATAVAAGEPLEPTAETAFRDFCRAAGLRILAVAFAGEERPRIVVREGEVDDALRASFLADAARGRRSVRTHLRRPRTAGDPGSSALHVPVLAAGRLEATVSALRVPGDPFSDDERAAIRRLANVVALAWVTERYREERARAALMTERRRIADDLHDRVAQLLFSSDLGLQSLAEDLDPGTAVRDEVVRVRGLVVRSAVALRDAIHQLSPPDHVDVVAAIRSAAQEVEQEFGTTVAVDASPGADDHARRVPGAVAGAALKAAREAMVNAAKHAGPCRVRATVEATPGRLRVVVADDGPGVPPGAPEGYGLRSARRVLGEHGGALRIGRRDGSTEVEVTLPLSPADQTAAPLAAPAPTRGATSETIRASDSFHGAGSSP